MLPLLRSDGGGPPGRCARAELLADRREVGRSRGRGCRQQRCADDIAPSRERRPVAGIEPHGFSSGCSSGRWRVDRDTFGHSRTTCGGSASISLLAGCDHSFTGASFA